MTLVHFLQVLNVLPQIRKLFLRCKSKFVNFAVDYFNLADFQSANKIYESSP
jgi:hypothetical protein